MSSNISNNLTLLFGKSLLYQLPIYKLTYCKNELALYCYSKYILPILFFLKQNTACQFKILIDNCGVDYYYRTKNQNRFEIVYLLLSIKNNSRLKIFTALKKELFIDSSINIYSNSDWFERETWDMFGIFFTNHPDLRRLLTDYGFEGHPLRKDFPLTGYVEVRYDEFKKNVVFEPVTLAQEIRLFNYKQSYLINYNLTKMLVIN